MSPSQLKGVIRNGRVEVNEPINLPEGTEVVVTSEATDLDDGPISPAEIARVLAAMHQLQSLEIPTEVGADLDLWERELDRSGIDNADAGLGDVFR